MAEKPKDEEQLNFRVDPAVGAAINRLLLARKWGKKKNRLFLGALLRLLHDGEEAMVDAVTHVDAVANANKWKELAELIDRKSDEGIAGPVGARRTAGIEGMPGVRSGPKQKG